mmetsp:Transcript_135972/g.261111  ORF Transcript_135972/g.261111 Transcript_135972/m.261111 type:complete len:295 (+) Transcript_135972:900-1784(+)
MTISQETVSLANQVRFATIRLQAKSSGIVQILLSRASRLLLDAAAVVLNPLALQLQHRHQGRRNPGHRDVKTVRMTMKAASRRSVIGAIIGRASARRHAEVAKLVLLGQRLPQHLVQNLHRHPLAVVPALAVAPLGGAAAELLLAVALAPAVVLALAVVEDRHRHPALADVQHQHRALADVKVQHRRPALAVVQAPRPPHHQDLPRSLGMSARLLRVSRARSRSIKMAASASATMVEAPDVPSYAAVLSPIMEEIVDRQRVRKSSLSSTIRTHTSSTSRSLRAGRAVLTEPFPT